MDTLGDWVQLENTAASIRRVDLAVGWGICELKPCGTLSQVSRVVDVFKACVGSRS